MKGLSLSFASLGVTILALAVVLFTDANAAKMNIPEDTWPLPQVRALSQEVLVHVQKLMGKWKKEILTQYIGVHQEQHPHLDMRELDSTETKCFEVCPNGDGVIEGTISVNFIEDVIYYSHTQPVHAHTGVQTIPASLLTHYLRNQSMCWPWFVYLPHPGLCDLPSLLRHHGLGG